MECFTAARSAHFAKTKKIVPIALDADTNISVGQRVLHERKAVLGEFRWNVEVNVWSLRPVRPVGELIERYGSQAIDSRSKEIGRK